MKLFKPMVLTELYDNSPVLENLRAALEGNANEKARVKLDGLSGSLPAVLAATLAGHLTTSNQIMIAPSKEDAYYLAGDLEALLTSDNRLQTSVYLFPTSYRKAYNFDPDETDNSNILMRGEVVKALAAGEHCIVVTWPEALAEKVPAPKILADSTLRLAKGMEMELDTLIDKLQSLGFEREDFVVEGGQFAVRGGIVDVYSLASEHPYRIEFFGDVIDSLRTFDAATQLSIKQLDRVDIVGRVENGEWRVENGDPKEASSLSTLHSPLSTSKVSLLAYFSSADVLWAQNIMLAAEHMESLLAETKTAREQRLADTAHPIAGTLPEAEDLTCSANEFLKELQRLRIIEHGNSRYFSDSTSFKLNTEPQPVIGKQFDMLAANLSEHADLGYRILITVSNESQQKRLEKVGVKSGEWHVASENLFAVFNLSHGFVDHDNKVLCYTDHEIFERYHKYSVRTPNAGREAMTMKELFELQPGDYVTHIDYGVGRFSGLEKVTNNGKSQELIRLIYKGGDVLYISIHGLHKISRYVGREGEPPQMNRLGSNTWQVLKQRTKKQVKDIARDLIALYAKRRASRGFAFSTDGEMQAELEASFLYEDTPDQLKATIAVKHDMEEPVPMDRLVCGDVGFGKTEVAIRAAFKACCDSKQVAVLVPSTILAFQHYNTFTERLKGMPVRVDYLNRFRTAKEKKQIYDDVASGRIDILIGTHAITNKELKFKDLGLLIIDEEQKFGVSAKEKLKQMKVGVDCLTLTATPIPRTLQFSLMGARDLSIIRTPPPNRQPIETELSDFNEELIRDAISFEMSRGGQTFFISNRVENLPEMAGMVSRLVPDAHVAMAHGRMDGKDAEETLMRFLEGDIDVLVATSIVENGLDIPNANTMIINNAHQFGLSDLHQLRGRVGRSNRKAFCYLMVPSYLTLTDEAQRRLRAISEFAAVGSGFNIAMRDLDIRGAGNILGAEQSGFISEVGYDMYHKILNEALDELRMEINLAPNPSSLTPTPSPNGEGSRMTGSLQLSTPLSPGRGAGGEASGGEAGGAWGPAAEAAIETDLEALLPDDYVTSVSERLLLYRELGDLSSDKELDDYRARLRDRFGPLPEATEELIRTVVLRREARTFGISKIILKQERMVLHFPDSQEHPFYKSAGFMNVIRYAQANPRRARLKEDGSRLVLTIANIPTVTEALTQMKLLLTNGEF